MSVLPIESCYNQRQQWRKWVLIYFVYKLILGRCYMWLPSICHILFYGGTYKMRINLLLCNMRGASYSPARSSLWPFKQHTFSGLRWAWLTVTVCEIKMATRENGQLQLVYPHRSGGSLLFDCQWKLHNAFYLRFYHYVMYSLLLKMCSGKDW